MNYYVESDLGDYGVRDMLGSARDNFTWILRNRDILQLSKYDHDNLKRCCDHVEWSSKMCRWLDSVRVLNDSRYAEQKTEKRIKAIQKKIDRDADLRISMLKRKINALEASIMRVKGF